MHAGNWFGKKSNRSGNKIAQQPLEKGTRRKRATGLAQQKLRIEELEDRRMLATYIVNNLGDLDTGGNVITGSLRHALNLSNASGNVTDTIVFADFLFTHPTTRQTAPGTIFLNGGQLNITDQVEILGPGSGTLTIAADAESRIFNISIDADNQIRGLTIGGMRLTGGNIIGEDDAARGGAIYNREALTLVEVIVENSSAARGGGAIYQPFGSLNIVRSLIMNNSSGGGGGAIFNGSDEGEIFSGVTISNSTITGNSTFSVGGEEPRPGWGGAVFNRRGNVEIGYSTIVSNSSAAGGGGVASYGVPLEDDNPEPITTGVTHSILFGNSTGGNPDDLYLVRQTVGDDEPELLIPTLSYLEYNFVGWIGGAQLFDDPATGTFNFYQAVRVPGDDGIAWDVANQAAGGYPHLATLQSAEENEFAFSVADSPIYWRGFAPDDPGADPPPPPPQNIGPWLGGYQNGESDPVDPAANWEWVAPDTFDPDNPNTFPFDDFTAWNTTLGQPDDGAATDPENPPLESYLAFHGSTQTLREPLWGDFQNEPEDEFRPIAFVIEFDQGTNYFNFNPELLQLGDYGGSTPVFYPGAGSPVIDAGNPQAGGDYEQRGRHFQRVFGAAIDIGAVEVQSGFFVVDELLDETDGQYSSISATYTGGGDFALREAIEFSEKNPEVDTILFSAGLQNLPDPTASVAPTILLKLRTTARTALSITQPVFIVGPTGFELEIDASGNDPTPTVNNADGTRILEIDNGSASIQVDVSISNLTLLGGDVVDRGGAISSVENLTITNSTIKDNSASNDGGAIFSQFGNLVVSSTTISGNRAGDDGGGIFVGTGTPGIATTAIVSNSTLSGNFAGDKGGGLYNSNGEVRIEFSTITNNNSASTRGAGVASMPGASALTQVRSSIVAANQGLDIEFLNGATNIQSLGYNLIGSGNATVVFNQPGDLKNVLNPKLAPLLNTGGRNATHRLLAGSPAIDAGDPAAVAGVGGVPQYDERGSAFTRVFDADFDTKARIDIGAYELQSTVFIVDSAADENDGNITQGNLSLREAIELSNSNPLADTITFSQLLAGATIFQTPANGGTLQPGTPTDMRITDSVTIIGLGELFLTLDGSNALTDVNLVPPVGQPISRSRFFTIDNGNNANEIDVVISDLTLTNSTQTTMVGGSIKSTENLTLERVSFINNSTLGLEKHGGAIYQRFGSLTLDGVTLTANQTDGSNADGGGIFARDTELNVLNNTSISGNLTNQTLGSGGGIFLQSSTLTMNYSSVSGNLAPGGQADGAGIYGVQSVMNITDSTISGNTMTGSNSEGAGIFSKNSVLNLLRTPVSFNGTTGSQSEGAGLYLSGGTTTITDSVVSFNTTTGHSSTGAGIAIVAGATVVIDKTSMVSNTTTGANSSGGAIHNLGGILTVRNSTISNGSVSGTGSSGGAIFSDTNLTGSQSTTIINSTISGNSSNVQGGGVFNADGLTVIRHSTITDNSVLVFSFGGGVGSFGNSATTRTEVFSSIIAGNDGSDVDRIGGNFHDTFLSLGYNVVGTGLTAAFTAQKNDITNVLNPGLSPLQFNGGPTSTHALLDGSPAVNAGAPGSVPGQNGVPQFDQRGDSRVQGGRIDIGAYESDFTGALPGDFNGDGVVNGRDFLAWQRNPSSGSLSDWQTNYGTSSLVASVVTTDEVAEPVLASLVVDESEPATVSETSPAAVAPAAVSDSPMLVGWNFSSSSATESSKAKAEIAESNFDAALLATYAGSFDDLTIADADSDFGDIATDRSTYEDDDESAEDSVFELLGAAAF